MIMVEKTMMPFNGRVNLCGRNENKYWDDFVESCPSASFYLHSHWLKCLEKAFGFKSLRFKAVDEQGTIHGVFPLVEMRDIRGHKVLISLPFSNYAGTCCDDSIWNGCLFQAAWNLAREQKLRFLEIRSLDVKIEEFPADVHSVNYFLELREGESQVWKHLHPNKRNKIRKALRYGLTNDRGRNYLDQFYWIFARNMRRLGTPPYPLKFFQTILDEYEGESDIIVTKKGKAVISAMLLIFFRQSMAVPWASSMREFWDHAPNELMYWEAIRLGTERKVEDFDLGRSPIGGGTSQFKIDLGAKAHPLFYHYILRKGNKVPNIQDKYRRAVSIWKLVPFELTVLLGGRIIKHLPEL
ncbi:MAG: FemAB family PEP-CTERM system-associated protein [Candidatus Aminicenantes bacterium]|nr:FemAB family PEP-CTERM system-associated protein [Candidatus Aminicenantes bacterium]